MSPKNPDSFRVLAKFGRGRNLIFWLSRDAGKLEAQCPGALEALRNKDWKNPRPGYVFKNFSSTNNWTNGGYFLHASAYFCQECGADHPPVFMIQNDLWKRLYPEGGIACQDCTEERLGRPLGVDEFTNAPCNFEQVEALGGPSVMSRMRHRGREVTAEVLRNHHKVIKRWRDRHQQRVRHFASCM